MHKYIALDTETTGVDFAKSQVIDCGVIFLDENMQPIEKKEWKVNYKPDLFDWSVEAEEVHKISGDTALNHGIDPEKFLDEFKYEVLKHYGEYDEVHIIALNAYFDYLMLFSLWEKYKRGPFFISRRVVDLTSLSLMILGDSGSTAIRDRLGITAEEDKLHSALYDAEMHLQIFHSLATVATKEGIQLL